MLKATNKPGLSAALMLLLPMLPVLLLLLLLLLPSCKRSPGAAGRRARDGSPSRTPPPPLLLLLPVACSGAAWGGWAGGWGGRALPPNQTISGSSRLPSQKLSSSISDSILVDKSLVLQFREARRGSGEPGRSRVSSESATWSKYE